MAVRHQRLANDTDRLPAMPRITTLLPLAAASLALTGLTFAQTAPSTVPPLTTEATQVTRQAPSQPAPRKGSLAADPAAKKDPVEKSGKATKARKAASKSPGKKAAGKPKAQDLSRHAPSSEGRQRKGMGRAH